MILQRFPQGDIQGLPEYDRMPWSPLQWERQAIHAADKEGTQSRGKKAPDEVAYLFGSTDLLASCPSALRSCPSALRAGLGHAVPLQLQERHSPSVCLSSLMRNRDGMTKLPTEGYGED